MCRLILFPNFIWNIYHSKKNWTRYGQKWYWCSCKIHVILVRFSWKLNLIDRFSKHTQISNFMKIPPPPVGAELFHVDGRRDGQTDRHNEASSRLSQFCDKRLKPEVYEKPNGIILDTRVKKIMLTMHLCAWSYRKMTACPFSLKQNLAFLRFQGWNYIKKRPTEATFGWHPLIIPADVIEVCCVWVRGYSRAPSRSLRWLDITLNRPRHSRYRSFCLPFYAQLLLLFYKT
jgi:hypothetical protein